MTVQGVKGEAGAMGYFGLTYLEENTDIVKGLEVDGGDGCVFPSVKTVQDGTYAPLSRPLFIYVNNASYAEKAVGEGVRGLLRRQRRPDRPVGPVRSPHGRADHQRRRTNSPALLADPPKD